MYRMRGFTLVELMITVVIVAILATVALPSYLTYSTRSNRTAAKTLLSQIAQQQENWFGDRKRYASSLSLLGYPANYLYITSNSDPQAASTSSSIYRISLAGAGTGDYTHCVVDSSSAASTQYAYALVAQPQNSQLANDTVCGTICLYSTGQRGAALPVAASDVLSKCWSR